MKKYFFFIVIHLIFTNHVYSQIRNENPDDLTRFLQTGKSLTCSFLNFDETSLKKTALISLFISGAYFLDYNARDLSKRNHSDFNNNLFYIDKIYGSPYTLIGIAGFYGYGIISGNRGIRTLGLQIVEAAAYSGLITAFLKSLLGRSRPYTNENKFSFHPINFTAANTAFPSGHSTLTFAVSTVLANNTNNLFLKIFYFTAAGLVAAARVYHNAHWLSDAAAGSVIGYLVGDFVSTYENESQHVNKVYYHPYFSGHRVGIVINF